MTVGFLMATLALPGWDAHLPSLLDQSHPADEVRVVIDRPTDAVERARLAECWPDVTFQFNERNLGLTASLNCGLSASRVDVVFRADDDDQSRPDRIERQLACFEKTGADLVGSWAEGRAAEAARPYLIRCPTDDAAIRKALLRRNVLIHPSLAFRRSAVLALGGYDETFVNAQDYALYLAAMRAGLRFAAVPEPLVVRHYSADNISVGRRGHQIMYSCAARVVHHAATGDRPAFLRTLAQYAALAATPDRTRRWRRRLFGVLGRGA